MSAEADIGHGGTVTFLAGATAFSPRYKGTISSTGEVRDVLDATEFASPTATGVDGHVQAFKEKKPGMADPGTVTAEIYLDPDEWPTAPSLAGELPTRNGVGSVKFTAPIPKGKTNGATLTCDGFVAASPWTWSPEGLMESTLTIELSGVPVYVHCS
jgi:hypothetical protein